MKNRMKSGRLRQNRCVRGQGEEVSVSSLENTVSKDPKGRTIAVSYLNRGGQGVQNGENYWKSRMGGKWSDQRGPKRAVTHGKTVNLDARSKGKLSTHSTQWNDMEQI